ncbi:MAG: hypothetical protein BWX88_03132 [Planctomycetes bacterium ADurb.Bin126]|nr:MAG: hypothetical protein BWX88_03132 [Planctomycetes bacterium ADurb.Bin126]HOD82275.1 hypothetical protein [Phycisphaerae bacterium]HQL72912.1 hypothetical protein [Phycisphaerae bacterium]
MAKSMRLGRGAAYMMFVLCLTAAATRAEQAAGLSGHWTFDDLRSGGAVADSSPSRLHATASALKAECVVEGRFGRALRFPGAGIISLSEHAARLGKLTDFSVSMWVRCEGGPSRMLLAFSDGTERHRVQVEVHNAQLHFGWQNGGPWTAFHTPPLKWEPATWYHVVFSNDSKAGKTILRSNDLQWVASPNTLSPGALAGQVTRVEIGSLHGQYPFHGCVDDVRLYDRALSPAEQLALFESAGGKPPDSKWQAAKAALLRQQERVATIRRARERLQRFEAGQAGTLGQAERHRKADWLFQAGEDDLPARAGREIAWTGEMIARLEARADAPDLSAERTALKALERRLAAAGSAGVADELAFYFEVRSLKRRVMFKSPAVDFSSVICVDAPYPHRSPQSHGTFQQLEWVHESRFRSEMCASHGAKLLVVDDLAGWAAPRKLAPLESLEREAAMMSFDLSFDARRAVFCMKPADEKAYHLYEVDLAGGGKGFRQITRGGYSDIDPVYLPDGRLLFLSTRADVYAQCGMWARSYVLTRCDADGSNVYILSPATEPEYSPSLMADGQVLFTRWEYVDKFANRIQSLWTMRPDGTAASAFWGNQSVQPDHLGEARQIPGTSRVMFSGFGHHDVWHGCIGIVDPTCGLNYPDGLWKVTQELRWPEVGDGPAPSEGAARPYHASGPYVAYKTPYPLDDEFFLVSARTGERENGFMHSGRDASIGRFKLYLMDVYGNRELIYQGEHNVLYAQPVRPRRRPPILGDQCDRPGSERAQPTVRPGVLFSSNIFDAAPPELRQHGRYLRVIQMLPKNYSIGIVSSGGKPFGADGPNTAWGAWGEQFLRGKSPTANTDVTWGDSAIFSGPATSLTGPLGIKQVLGVVPLAADGSICIKVPPCRMLYFQVLDEHHRAIHTMRSWVSLQANEYRGCVGCHEQHNRTPAARGAAPARVPDTIEPPPWGVRSLSYVRDIQPVFDRACVACHSGKGEAVKALDLTLRPDPRGTARWGGIFPEPYLTLLLGRDSARVGGACPGFGVSAGYVAVPNTISTSYQTLPPLSCLSPRSRLIERAMDRRQCGRNLSRDDLRMLIAWVDLWAMYRSDDELREIDDPPAQWFPLWSSPPRMRSAPRVRTEYSQDEYLRPEDRH